jgi:hypothetical protein
MSSQELLLEADDPLVQAAPEMIELLFSSTELFRLQIANCLW